VNIQLVYAFKEVRTVFAEKEKEKEEEKENRLRLEKLLCEIKELEKSLAKKDVKIGSILPSPQTNADNIAEVREEEGIEKRLLTQLHK